MSHVFVELADTLVDDFDVTDFLHTLTRRCVDLFDVDAAGLMVSDAHGELRLVAASTEQIALLELFELQSEEGPCLDSYRSGRAVHAPDLQQTEQWPRFRREVLASGYRSVEALPLRLRGHVVGALNLFRAEPGGLEGHELAICQAMADVATISLLQARAVREARTLADQLNIALNSRVVIEQAKGVLAERSGVDVDMAFRMMRGYARRKNLRLADVARDVVARRLDLSRDEPSKRPSQ